MLEWEVSAIASTTAAKHTNTTRMVVSSCFSSMWGIAARMTFSLRMTDGASRVALEQLITAESTAPKNITCAKSGVCSTINVGRTSWASCSNKDPNFTGSTNSAEYAMNIGTKQNTK